MSLKDKKAMLAFSTGASQTMFQPDGINGDINVALWPLQVCSIINLKSVTNNKIITMKRKYSLSIKGLFHFSQNGTLHFCGFQVLAPQIFWGPAHCPAQVRIVMPNGWRVILRGLFAEWPLTFAPCELFDLSFQEEFLLRPEVREESDSHPCGLTTGHHLGKPLPHDNQTKAPSQ